jgi:hypothetical protein
MRLLTLTLNEIQEVVTELDKESKALKEEIYKLAWYMRGAISITEAYTLDSQDREIINKIILDNLQTAKETGLPFF